MIGSRIRKILRDVWARKGRTFLVATAIFIGVTGTIALFSMSDILVGQLRTDIKEDELPMVQVSMSADPDAQLENEAYMKALADYPDVTTVQGGFSETPIFFKSSEDEDSFEDGFVKAYAVLNEQGELVDAPMDAPAVIDPYRVVAGTLPAPGANELSVETRMADEYGLSVGDTLYVRALSPSRDPATNGQTGTTEAWTITAIVFDPYAFTPKTTIYTDVANADYLAGRTGFNDFWLRFTSYDIADEQFEEIQSFIAENTPYTVAFAQTEDPAQSQLITGAQTISNLMGVLALVALIVSGFLVINVISSLVVEQKRQIGVMKSLGATRGDNFKIYSGIAFMYGLIGVIPGVILGIPAGNAAAHALAPEVNTIITGFRTSTFSIVLGVVVGLAVPVLASIIPVWGGTRVRILEAMTDLGIDANYGTGPLARIINKLPIPITIRQGLSNISLKKSRLTFTVITLSIAVGAFMGIFAIFESLTSGINLFIDSFNIDIGVFPSEPRDPDEVTTLIQDNFADDIQTMEPGFQIQVNFKGYEPELGVAGPPGIFGYGYDVTSDTPAFKFEISEGEKLTAENASNGIVLSSLLAANMDKTVGDTVVLQVPGNEMEMNVVGIADFPLEQAWADWHTLANIAGYTFDTIVPGTPLPEDAIPAEVQGFLSQAGSFIKYSTVVGIEDYAGSMPNDQVLALGLTPAVAPYLTFDEGSFPGDSGGDTPGVIISSDLASQLGLSVGDTLPVIARTADGSQGLPVVGIFSLPPMLQSGMSADFIGMFWRDLATLDGATIQSEPLPQGWFIITPIQDPTADELQTILDDMNDTLIEAGVPTFSLNFVELTDQISSGFATFQAILSAVAGLIAVVGALGLLTTLSMSVFERQKEIGVMRSIGAGSGTIAGQFLTEGLVVGIIAWIVGLPMMVLLQKVLLSVTGFDETFPFELSYTAMIVGLVGMLIITALASLGPSLGAARKTVSDILRYQ
ncbi:ABC transporter permease [Aggregatilinea lenta]|uniref:ABC transporter permease n=1 Tax=Aggregatilinea lenta TaxID=913108 RepID=UPI000E5BCCEE|nr:FtsX-like permease family protein [Aggregatilinea lenta]